MAFKYCFDVKHLMRWVRLTVMSRHRVNVLRKAERPFKYNTERPRTLRYEVSGMFFLCISIAHYNGYSHTAFCIGYLGTPMSWISISSVA